MHSYILYLLNTHTQKKPSSAPSASDDLLHSSSTEKRKKEKKKRKPVFNPSLVSLCVVCDFLWGAVAAAAAAVVADLPRVRGETETIVGLGLN